MPASILVAGVYTNLIAFSGDPVTVILSVSVNCVGSRRRLHLPSTAVHWGLLLMFWNALFVGIQALISLWGSIRWLAFGNGSSVYVTIVLGLVSANRTILTLEGTVAAFV
ncbi:hypothetical protein B0H19DRAFT_1137539 [Mycena capillaripes]|nr:hypothetical protein B0H19DRAFT_1137539 [Mycena capillaripes]